MQTQDNETQHTAGPWAISSSINNTESRVSYYIGQPVHKGLSMDECVEPVGLASNARLSMSKDECLANARLMAAAPQMLSALLEACNLIDRDDPQTELACISSERWRKLVSDMDVAIDAAQDGTPCQVEQSHDL